MNDDYSEKMKLVAPCGMNCGICWAYLREKNKCTGCRGTESNKPITRITCKIKNCENLQKAKTKFCSKCETFPCAKLKHLDKRYSTKYHMSMIENLKFMQKHGDIEFLKNQEKTWKCPKCGGVICCHNGLCFSCNTDLLKKRKKKLGWEEDKKNEK